MKAGIRANACVYRMEFYMTVSCSLQSPIFVTKNISFIGITFPNWGLGMSWYTQKDLDKSISHIYYHEHFLHLHFDTPKFALRLRDRVEILTGGESPRVPGNPGSSLRNSGTDGKSPDGRR
jgi:hypothetical protein